MVGEEGIQVAGTPGSQYSAQEKFSESVEEYLKLTSGGHHLGDDLSSTIRNAGAALFREITVLGGDTEYDYLATVADGFLFPARLAHRIFSKRGQSRKNILQNIDGIVKEGEMLLILGRPGSGATTLLKTLAGMTESFYGWEGGISYLGTSLDDIKKHFRGDVVYNAEADVHFPYLNVLNTLRFAVNTKTPTTKIKRQVRAQKIRVVTEALIKVFGLQAARDTLLGNEFISGVSGGERKRVSLAEIMSTNAKITLWDNSTQGLDATTSMRFGKSLQAYSKYGHNIAIAALYQASDDLVELFDKIALLHKGHQIFFGTIPEALEYLRELGFVWPDRQSLSEYLIAVTDEDLRATKEEWEDRVPRSVDDWVRCWKQSAYYAKLQEEIKSYDGDLTTKKPEKSSDMANGEDRFVLSWGAQLATTLQRAFLRLLGDKTFLGASIVGPIFIALIFGSAFYNTPNNTTGFFSRQGVLFFSLLFNSIQCLVEVTSQYTQRPIVKKQSSFAMYHAGIDAISSLISLFPVKFVGVTAFNVVLYFMANLKREPGAFFTFLLITYTTVLLMASFFRFVAAVSKHESTAVSIAGVLLLPLIVYTGYVIPTKSMHPWFKWISYINPVAYSFEALMANEFHGRNVPCSQMIPSGPAYKSISPANQVCPVTGSVPGSNLVSGDRYIEQSFAYYHSHLWRNYAIVVAFFLFFIIAYGLAVEFVPQVEKGRGDILIFLRKGRFAGKREGKEEKATSTEKGIPRDDSGRAALERLEKSHDCFTWDKLEYQIPVKSGEKTLLTGIHGYVKPGTMTAMLGESGAGKTTLLNVLAQRTHMGSVSGSVLINGHPLGSDFARRTGYVESQDVHLSQFTVRETLRFSAQLRQPQSVTNNEKNRYVEEIISMLEMGEYADAVVGVPGSGLSLEQRKRMTVGIELVAKPSLLFLDEPTSGLDSQSSFAIIKCLRKLADSGQAILCTIHQPSSSLFEQFDRMLLLQKGGRCVYFGDIGSNSRDVIGYFESNGAFKCPPKTNPAEYVLLATETKPGKTEWADIWSQSSQAQKVEQEIAALSRPSDTKSPPHKKDATSYIHQYQLVQTRSLKFYWRLPIYIRGKALLNLAAGLFMGFTFYQEKNSAQGLQNKMFATFTSVVLSAPLMNQLQPLYFQIKNLYTSREEPAQMYHWSIFIFATAITEILASMITGTLFFIPWYFAVGFRNGMIDPNGRGAYMYILFLLFETWVSTFGQLLAAIAPTPQTAALLIPMVFVFVALFCGVLQPLSQLPLFWHWVHYASPFTWLIDGFFSNVLHATPVTCTALELNIFQPPSNMTCGQYIAPFLTYGPGALYNPSVMKDCHYCRYSTGDQYLKLLDMSWNDRWRNFGLMWVYCAFNVGAMVVVVGGPRVLRTWMRRREVKGKGL